MTNEPETPKKKRGLIASIFEELSRPLGVAMLVAMGMAQVFLGVTVHEVAWYTASLLVAGEHLLELMERVADKIVKALGLIKKNDSSY